MTEEEAREIVERYEQLLRSTLTGQGFASGEIVGHQLVIERGHLALATGWPSCRCGHARLEVELECLT